MRGGKEREGDRERDMEERGGREESVAHVHRKYSTKLRGS